MEDKTQNESLAGKNSNISDQIESSVEKNTSVKYIFESDCRISKCIYNVAQKCKNRVKQTNCISRDGMDISKQG